MSVLQVRTECLGAVLSALSIATPSIGARLQAAKPGRGRAAGAADEALGQVFQIAPELPDGVRTVSPSSYDASSGPCILGCWTASRPAQDMSSS